MVAIVAVEHVYVFVGETDKRLATWLAFSGFLYTQPLWVLAHELIMCNLV